MSKKKRRTRSKNRESGKVTRLPVRPAQGATRDHEQKLSVIIKELALLILKDPDASGV